MIALPPEITEQRYRIVTENPHRELILEPYEEGSKFVKYQIIITPLSLWRLPSGRYIYAAQREDKTWLVYSKNGHGITTYSHYDIWGVDPIDRR